MPGVAERARHKYKPLTGSWRASAMPAASGMTLKAKDLQARTA